MPARQGLASMVVLLAAMPALSPGDDEPPADRPPAGLQVRQVQQKVMRREQFLAGVVAVPAAPNRLNIITDDEMIVLESKPVDVAEDDELAPLAVRFAPFDIQAMALAAENFDRIVFRDDRSPTNRQAKLRARLALRVEMIGQARPLTPDQRQALFLAGTGDIRRYLDRVEQARREFEAARFDYERGLAAIKRLTPLASEFAVGPFGEGSLLAKVFTKLAVDAVIDPIGVSVFTPAIPDH